MPNDPTKAEFVKTNNRGEMFVFQSVADIAEYVNPDLYEEMSRSFVDGNNAKGEGKIEWSEVEERTKQEWEDGIKIFQRYVDQLTDATLPDVKDKKRRTRFATEGDDIDFDRMRQGYTDYWRKSARDEATGPATMTVVIDTTTPSFQNSLDILWRGAAAIALAKILEEKGWGVEIWVVNGSYLYDGESTPVYTACRLKRPEDPMDISTLINTVSGWFYRTATFALLRTIVQNRMKTLAYGYGTCATPSEEELDLLSPDEYRIYSAGVFSFDGAVEIIRAQLEKIRNEAIEPE